jgi:glyoxylase-like metal-dependent hydrolase (beta-lactamase superfamily II)
MNGLAQALLGIVVAGFAGLVLAQPPAPAPEALPFVLESIGPGVWAAIDGPKHQAGSNAGFVVGDDGVVVIDSFFSPNAARALLAEIRKVTPKPVKYVVNTHYHVDHTGGDAVFRAAGAIIVAHRNVRAWIHDDNRHLLGDRITPDQSALIDSLPTPDLTTTTALTLWLGTRRIDVRAYPGHTGGDLVVRVPDAKVVFTGDLLWRRTSPNIIDGTLSRWIPTEDAFLALPDAAATTFVPGHGQLASASDVQDFRAYLETLVTLVSSARAAGLAGEALRAEVEPKLAARFGGWDAFGYFAPREIAFTEAELTGSKRIPKAAGD